MSEKSLQERLQSNEFRSKLHYGPSKEQKQAYREDVRRLNAEFKVAALEEVGLAGHPKADKAYDLAWDRGHSSGLHEVLIELQELADLLSEDA